MVLKVGALVQQHQHCLGMGRSANSQIPDLLTVKQKVGPSVASRKTPQVGNS